MSQGRAETERILLLTEGRTTPLSAKTATGVLRYSLGQVVGLIDSTQAGRTASELLGVGGDIPVFAALGQAPEPPQLTVEHLEGEAGLELRASYVAWQNTAATDVRLIAEGSSDLRVWRPLNAVQTFTQRDRRLECRWTHQAAAAEAPVMFYRLRIVRR